MPGHFVFPGGMVDQSDRDATVWLRRVDLEADTLESRFGGGFPLTDILAYGVAAIRETFEEAGVRLWEVPEGVVETMERLEHLRGKNQLDNHWLKTGANDEDWCLCFSRLHRWAHWITPVALRRRFDTRFYLAVLSKNQTCTPDYYETTHGRWIAPSRALTESRAGELPLSPPTLVTLHELLKYPNVASLLARRPWQPWGKPIMPRLIATPDNSLFLLPWDPEYGKDPLDVDFTQMEKRVLPVGADFSRIWESQGICRPVSVYPLNP
jgi:8-oxo-dGTP pyrophosphatase MutT (NUDIX family)